MPPARSRPPPHGAQLPAVPARAPGSPTEMHRGTALCLTLNSDPRQKKCRLVILQRIRCVLLSVLCIGPNIFRLESKFTDRAVTAEDQVSGLRFCVPSVPRHDRDLWRAVSIRALLGSINEFPGKLFTSLGCISDSNISALSRLYISIYALYIHSHTF